MGPGPGAPPGGAGFRGPAYGIYLKAMLNAQAHINYHVLLYATHIQNFILSYSNFFIHFRSLLLCLNSLFLLYLFLSFDYFDRKIGLKI